MVVDVDDVLVVLEDDVEVDVVEVDVVEVVDVDVEVDRSVVVSTVEVVVGGAEVVIRNVWTPADPHVWDQTTSILFKPLLKVIVLGPYAVGPDASELTHAPPPKTLEKALPGYADL